MATFRMRVVKPSESSWHDVQGEDLNDAISTWHRNNVGLPWGADLISSLRYANAPPSGGHEWIHFSLVEVDGSDALVVARTFRRGIYRSGGVRPPWPQWEAGVTVPAGSIEWIALKLGWTQPVADLLAPWEGEETWDDAKRCSTS